MKEEDILREAETIHRELQQERPQKEKPYLRTILMVLLGLLMVLMIIPYYSVRVDPEPKAIPSLQELTLSYDLANSTVRKNSRSDFLTFLEPNDPRIKQVADRIAAASCQNGGKVCYAKAMFYFTRDNIRYISDPPDEYLKHPLETLTVGAGDCDDYSILLANLLEAIGFRTQFVFIPGHVWVQVYLPDAAKKYKVGGWVNLDATCSDCVFGEIPIENGDKRASYL